MINNKWGLRRDMGLHSNRYLFRSQCFYRTDSRSLDGWDETGDGAGDDDGDGGCDASADAHGRVDKHGSLEETGVHGGMTYRGIHDFIGGYATHHADVSEDTGDDDALGDDELQYRPRFGTDGLAHAKLSGALLHGDEHDVAYAHDAAEQGEQAHYPQGYLDDGDALVHLYVVHISVPKPDGAVVIGSSQVVVVDASTIAFLESLVVLLGLQVLEGELDGASLVALGIDGLHGREGGESLVVLS